MITFAEKQLEIKRPPIAEENDNLRSIHGVFGQLHTATR